MNIPAKILQCTVAAVFGLATGISAADTLTFNFTGSVTRVVGTPCGITAATGTTMEGTIAYDPSLPAAYDTGTVAGYIQPLPSGMSVEIAGTNIQSAGNASLQVLNDAYGVDNLNGYFGAVSVEPVTSCMSMVFYLGDFTQTAFSSTALPGELNAEDFSQRTGSIYQGYYPSPYLNFSIDSIVAEEPVIPVAINVKPGSFPNSINPGNRGVIAVAILTTDAFDATTVDPETIQFGRTGTEADPHHYALEDIDGNGAIDVILNFQTQDTGIVCGDTSAVVTGETFTEQMIEGSDDIVTVPCP